MSEALQFALNFVNCGGCRTCGASLILEKSFYEARRHDHKSFYCPNGHSQYYPQTSDMEKLKSELEQTKKFLENAKKRTEWAEQDAKLAKGRAETEKRRSAAYRGQLTRVKNGVCPCCRRNFTDLRQHMATKHPDYQSEK